MCNYSDKFIFVSGGFSSDSICLDTVMRFNINTEVWEDVESLNVKRSDHSSCSLKESIYVAGGFTIPLAPIKTIEKLDVNRSQSRW